MESLKCRSVVKKTKKDLQVPLNCDSQRPPDADKERQGVFQQEGTQVSTIWGVTAGKQVGKRELPEETGSGKKTKKNQGTMSCLNDLCFQVLLKGLS